MVTVTIRDALIDDAPALARILIDTNRSTFAGLVPEACLTGFTVAESERNWRRYLAPGAQKQGERIEVVEGDTGQVVAYAIVASGSRHQEFGGELRTLMVATPWQRQGIGRRLVVRAARWLAEKAVNTMLVGVQVDNPNRRFYERLGAEFVGTVPLQWDEYATAEALYGWRDTSVLLVG